MSSNESGTQGRPNDSRPIDEIQVMSQASNLLAQLEDDHAVSRVLKWLADKHGVQISGRAMAGSSAIHEENGDVISNGDNSIDIAEFYYAASPKTDSEKALVISVWMHKFSNASDIEAQSVNRELKQLGYGVSNITRAFESLMKSTPRLAIQVRKSGRSKQSRKRYRVTEEGFRRVREMTDQGGLEIGE